MPAPRRVRRNSEDLDRQGAEVRLARAGARGRVVMTASRKSGWPSHCRAALARALRLASRQFPHAGEDEATRVHDVRKTLKGAAGLARIVRRSHRRAGRGDAGGDQRGAAQGRPRPRSRHPARRNRLARSDARIRDALIAAIAEQRETERRAHHDIDVSGLAAELRALANSVETWDVEAAGATPLIVALRRTYCTARRRGDAALPGGAPGELHALRVRGRRPRSSVRRVRAGLAGDDARRRCANCNGCARRSADNDLSVLAEFVAARRADAGTEGRRRRADWQATSTVGAPRRAALRPPVRRAAVRL